MSGIIATKIGMSRVFHPETGDALPVTYLKVEPNTVVRTKTEDKDGYNAVVLGVGGKKHKTKNGKELMKFRTQKEWQVEDTAGYKAGSELTCSVIPEESTVTVTGVSKGKGFQGVIKRHGFSRGPETHGSHHHRRPGSVGMCEFPGRILKGKKMPGRMGTDQVTLRGRAIISCDPTEGIVAVKGPVPGPNGATVFLTFEFEPELAAAPVADEPAADEAPAEVAPAEEAPKEEVKAEEKPEEAKADEAPAEESASAEATEDKEKKEEEAKADDTDTSDDSTPAA